MSFVIESGPFKGVTPQQSELDIQQNDRGTITIWGTHHRTRAFLDVFNPLSGWSIDINVRDPGLQMQDLFTLDENDRPSIQPTREFEAVLSNPEGRVVARAAILKIINSEHAWKAGVTGARGALYEALGLPGSLDGAVEGDDSVSATPRSSIKSVVSADKEQGTDVIKGLVDTGESFAVVAVGESEDTFDSNIVVASPHDPEQAASTASESNSVADRQGSGQGQTIPVQPARPKSPQSSAEDRAAKAIASKSRKTSTGVPKGLSNRIKKLYQEAGIDVPDYHGIEEATQVLNRIMQGSSGGNIAIQGELS